jgi:gas vesicle protein
MKNSYKILIAVGAGLIAGGLLGVLFAPDKGSNIRHKIADNGKRLKDELNRKVKFGKHRRSEKEPGLVNGELEEVL